MQRDGDPVGPGRDADRRPELPRWVKISLTVLVPPVVLFILALVPAST
ncbi:hypothetical protein HBB16_07670 [Pseudonocardia sp. MCCB 268]|nr:hypothetical protein [Pseudonocardia cytotoxica]